MRAIHNSGGLGNPFLAVVANLFGGASQAGGNANNAFLTAQAQSEAADLAAARSRRWSIFGVTAVVVAGAAGLIYIARR